MTSIEWVRNPDGSLGKTWNPTAGCSLESPGCTNCYAMKMAHRLARMGQEKYIGLTKAVNGKPVWTGELRADENAILLPLRVKKPTMWFVNSMSDLFHEDLPLGIVHRIFDVMSRCPQHTFQVLTKRPGRMQIYAAVRNPPPNIWLGASVEDQKRKGRIDVLRNVRAAVRFLSIEPLLEDLGDLDLTGIHWVIVGGESGPGARPFDLDWARSIVAQCRSAGTPCFVKQIGSKPQLHGFTGMPIKNRKGGDMSEWPADLRIREFPKVSS